MTRTTQKSERNYASYIEPAIASKNTLREKLKQDIEKFLAAGNKINKVGIGVSGEEFKTCSHPVSKRREIKQGPNRGRTRCSKCKRFV